MASEQISLRNLNTFGSVAAEDDAVLSYFLTTDAVKKIQNNEAFLVLGRKGSGKTALVRHFAEGDTTVSKAITLGGYPWTVHAERIDRGASDVEAYVASWRYLIAVELAIMVMMRAGDLNNGPANSLRVFLKENYGGVKPDLGDLLRPPSLKLSKLSFEPQILGNKLGGVALDRTDLGLGRELEALSSTLLEAVGDLARVLQIPSLILHFDELDQGLTVMDDGRKKILIGLLLAARRVRQEFKDAAVPVNPVVYLRTDLWEDLEFSDKNKITQTLALNLGWDSAALLALINERIRAKLGENASWPDIADTALMRGSQTKWDHVLARTFLRPRDVISFLNSAREIAIKRSANPLVFENEDIVNARDKYSVYLKQELDDEIGPHWGQWEEALQACSAMATITFDKDQFVAEYTKRRSSNNPVSADEAIRLLFDFSVIGYERRSGYGGSSWVFQYTSPEAGWDTSASRFKVHLGLKEYAKLREERVR